MPTTRASPLAPYLACLFSPAVTASTFQTFLEPVAVPEGCYPIEVVQFWRGAYAYGQPHPLHWAIVVRTAPHRGNTHELVGGSTDTYAMQVAFNVPLDETAEDWRGNHVVGYVAPERMDFLLGHMALTPVARDRWAWNCQHWVYEALRGLRYPGLYTDKDMTLGALQTQMCCLLEAWELGEI